MIASKYFVQYIFGAASNAAIVPLIDSVGVGIASTIGSFSSYTLEGRFLTFLVGVILVILAGILVLIVATYGRDMQIWIDFRIHPEDNDEKK